MQRRQRRKPLLRICSAKQFFEKIVNIYARECFTIRVIFMYMEFEKVSDDMELVKLNTTAARQNMVEIERVVGLIKERAISVIANLPFASLHKTIVIHLIYFLALWLNDFLYLNIGLLSSTNADLMPIYRQNIDKVDRNENIITLQYKLNTLPTI